MAKDRVSKKAYQGLDPGPQTRQIGIIVFNEWMFTKQTQFNLFFKPI